MTTPRVILMLALWLLYSLAMWQGCVRHCCLSGTTDEQVSEAGAATPAPEAMKRYPLDFKWSDPKPNVNDGFEALKRNYLAQMTESNILEITGFYFEDEKAPDGYENMGLARAAAVAELFKPELSAERIQHRARLIDNRDGMKEEFLDGVVFAWTEPPAEKAVETAEVEELEDRVIIRFPYNSTQKIQDDKIDEYLKKLADRVNKTGEKVGLTGHTDNSGTPEYNLKLGQSRAEAIKSILLGFGVKSDQISTESKGQSQPVASNNTEQGKRENRRVEVRYIKN